MVLCFRNGGSHLPEQWLCHTGIVKNDSPTAGLLISSFPDRCFQHNGIINSVSQVLLTDKKGNKESVKRYRDIVMRWKQEWNLAILACENQENIHYAMPVRAMVYDGLSYVEQIQHIQKENQKKGSFKSGGEFLSGLRKDDKLYPAITVVFYYGEEIWDGSKSLWEMIQFPEKESQKKMWESLVPDYHINLIEAGNIEELRYYKTDLQLIFGMIQCRQDKEKFQAYIMEHEDYFQNIDVETYDAVRALLNTKSRMKDIKLAETEGRVDMCKAIRDIYEEGIEQGIEQMIEQLVETWQEFGVLKEEALARIVDKQDISSEKAQEYIQKYWK